MSGYREPKPKKRIKYVWVNYRLQEGTLVELKELSEITHHGPDIGIEWAISDLLKKVKKHDGKGPQQLTFILPED